MCRRSSYLPLKSGSSPFSRDVRCLSVQNLNSCPSINAPDRRWFQPLKNNRAQADGSISYRLTLAFTGAGRRAATPCDRVNALLSVQCRGHCGCVCDRCYNWIPTHVTSTDVITCENDALAQARADMLHLIDRHAEPAAG